MLHNVVTAMKIYYAVSHFIIQSPQTLKMLQIAIARCLCHGSCVMEVDTDICIPLCLVASF